MMLVNLEKIGDRIRKVRHAYNLTQQEMADQLHITRSCLANYERGTRQPPIEILHYMAKHFEVDLDYLMCNTISPLMESFMTDFFNITRSISKDGRLDISTLTPTHKIVAVEFIKYLEVSERIEKRRS